MKELQNFLYKHMDSLKNHKRYVAMLTALSLLVSFVVPLILIEPADSMTKQRLMLLADSTGSSYPTSFDEKISGQDSNLVSNAAGTDGNVINNVTYSPAQMDILTLLFGAANDGTGNLTHQDLYAGCTTIEEALEVDKETYFLGYASDFCAFIEGDFTATEADAEGRVAVGGDLSFKQKWNYQLGSGDYATMKPLQSISGYEEYNNMYGFASALVGGKMSRINTLSTGYGRNRDAIEIPNFDYTNYINSNDHSANTDQYSFSVFYTPEEGLFKYFVVGDIENSTHYLKVDGVDSDISYNSNLNEDADHCMHDVPGNCGVNIDDCKHTYLHNVNELSQMYSMPEGYTVKGLIYDTFEHIRNRSEALSHMQSVSGTANGKSVVFDGAGNIKGNIVYFNIDNWNDFDTIQFKNIPENVNIVVNCGQTEKVQIGGPMAKDEINVSTAISTDGAIDDSDYICKVKTGVNNNKNSSRILYNFYNATEVIINGNFNGTVLAPNADVKSFDEQSPGHLSGALIAKSFYGGLEFGYRPYRSGSDILGMTSGYEVPVDKLIAGTTTLLPGAMFEIAEVINGEENVLSLFESDDSTKYVALPSCIDFSGNTAYIGESIKSDVVKVDETESFNNVGTIYSDLVITVSKDQNQNETLISPITVNSGTVLYLKTNHQADWTEPAKNNDNYNLEYIDNYTRKLTINNDNEKSLKFIASISNSSISDEVTINVNPVSLNVSPTEINWGDVLTFTHSGYPSDYRYEYCINNDQNRKFTTTDSEYEIAYTYDVTGKVPISLNVYNSYNSVVRTENYEITVNKPEIILPEECYKDASVNMSLSFTPADCSVEYYQVDSYGNNNTQYINGTQFNPSATGTYNIRAKITKNNQSIYTDTKTITVVEKLEPYLWVSSSTTNINDGITFEVKNLPDNVTVNNYSVTGGTISNNNTFTADQAGTYTITANLSNSSSITATITVTDSQNNDDISTEMYITAEVDENGQKVTPTTYYVNQTFYLGVANATTNNISYKIYAVDDNNNIQQDATGYIQDNMTFTPNQVGNLRIEAVIDGQENVIDDLIIQVVNQTYSLRRSSNYLADETVQIAAISGNMFVIQSPNGEPITKADLNLHNDNDYTIKYKIYSNNELKFTSDNITKSSLNNGNLVIKPSADYKADKIEIEIISGAVSLNSGNLTYEGSAIKTTHQAALEIQPDNDKKYTVTIQDTLSKIKDSMIQLDSFTFYLVPNASSGEINTNCWIYYQEDGQTKEQYVENCKFVDGEFCLTVNKMIDKIVIQAKDNNTELPIERFLAVATTNSEINETINKEITETHTYTIREAMAPQGYFKTDDYYEVTITETLNTVNVVDNTIPTLVDTVIDVKFIDVTTDNAGNITSTNAKDYYKSNLTIKYGTKDSKPDLNTRIIEVKNGTEIVETFTIVKNNDGDKITSVTASGNDNQLSYTVGEGSVDLRDSKATDFTYNNKKYYYNPETMMIIPLPLGNETEKNLEFSNESGILFKKVDDSGAMVSGATITVTTKNGDVTFTDSSKVFKVSDFEPLTEYTFTETGTPDGYETAKPIHFKLNENKTGVKWWSEDESEPTEYTSIQDAVIGMVDVKITGAKLKLKKVDENGSAIGSLSETNYATFNLYAETGAAEGVLIKENINVDSSGGIDVDLSDVDSQYVENGYLLPGNYYLVETKAPFNYKAQAGNIRFVVNDEFKMSFVDNDSLTLGLEKSYGWDDNGGVYHYIVKTSDGTMLNVENPDANNPIGIPNVLRIQVQADQNIMQYWFTKQNGNNVGSSSYSQQSIDFTYDSPILLDKVKFNARDNANFTITITTEDNKVYTYSAANNVPQLEILEIKNEEDDGLIDVPVQKIWTDDTGFEKFRTDVTLQLWRTTTEITDYNSITDGEQVPKLNADGQVVTDSTGQTVFETLTLTKDNVLSTNANIWETKFEDIKEADSSGNKYYFYIKEANAPQNYNTVGYSKTESGTLTVTNQLDPVNVKVEKIWGTKEGIEREIPDSVTLQLQIRIEADENEALQPENYTWENVEGKTITLNKAVFGDSTTWSGDDYKIEGLLKGKTYRLTDGVSNWEIQTQTPVEITDSNGTLSITNVPTDVEKGSLTIQKLWDTTEGLPDEVYVKLYRKAILDTYPQGQPATTQTDAETGETIIGVQEDYARLLQYSLYFYDANMCGDLAEEHSALAWRGDCHTEDDVYGGVDGGFHDAGDHAMFGLPQGYSASMLGWSYYEFKDAYDNLNQTAHLKAITEHFCDFFEQCIRENNGTTEILVQKGDGNIDHGYWGAPEKQNEDDTNHRKDEDQMFWVSNTGADIAAEYAAALALAYLNFNDGSQKYSDYLTAAEKLYAYANSVKNDTSGDRTWNMQANNQYANGCLNKWGINLDETQKERELNVRYPGFYLSDSCTDDIALAAGWLYLATGRSNQSYKDACFDLNNDVGSWAFSWNDVKLAAACVSAHVNSDQADPWAKARAYISGKNTSNFYYPPSDDGTCWGSARYNAALQMAALAVTKNDSQSDFKGFAKVQMAKILGNNNWGENGSGVCLVTGFAENSAKNAHHRAASGWESIDEYKDPTHTTYDTDGKTLIGAMVGGPYFGTHNEAQMQQNGHTNLTSSDTHGDYLDDLHDYCCNEVALDYQAGLVGAAAGLYYFYKTGHTYEIPGVEEQYLQNDTEAVTVDAGTYSSPNITQNNAVSVLVDESSINPTPVLTLSSDDISFGNTKDLTSSDLSNIVRIKYVFGFEKAQYSTGFGVKLYYNGGGEIWYQETSPDNDDYEYVLDLPTATGIDNLKIHKEFENGTLTIKNVYFYTTNSSDESEEGDDTGSDTQEFTLSIDKSMIKVNDGSATLIPNPSDNVQYQTINGLNINQNTVTGSIAGQYTITLSRGDESANVILNVVGLNKQDTEIQKDSYTEWTFEGLPDSVNPTWDITNNNNNVNVEYLDNQRKIKLTGNSAGTVNIKATVSYNGTTLEFNETITVVDNSSSGGDTNATAEVTTLDNYTVHKWDEEGDNWTWTSLGVDEGERVVKVEILLESNNNSNIGNFNGGMGTDGISLKADGSGTEWYQENLYVDNIQSTQYTLTWDISENESRDINYTKSLKFGQWNNSMPNVNVKSITIYTVVEASIIGVPSDGLMYGKFVQLDTKGLTEPIEWSVSNTDAAAFDENVNGKLIAKNVESDTDVTITARDANGIEATAVIKIKPFTFDFDSDTTEFKVRVGNTLDIPFNTSEPVVISMDANEYATVSGNTFTGVKSTDGNKLNFTATCNESTINGTIQVYDALSITAEKSSMYNGETLRLTAQNNIGNVTWSISDSTIADINSSGVVTAKKAGTVIVTATDSHDNTTATYEITINLKAVEAELPTDAEWVDNVGNNGIITITGPKDSDTWSHTLDNLSITDENGNYYMYYIVECDANGQVIGGDVQNIQGSGTLFVPTEYEHGVTLNPTNSSTVKVSNSLSGRVQGELPSTGGSGVKTYYYFGGAIMLLGIAGFTGLKRRERKRREE